MNLQEDREYFSQRPQLGYYTRLSRWTTIVTWIGSLIAIVLLVLVNVSGSGSPSSSHHTTRIGQNTTSADQSHGVNGEEYWMVKMTSQYITVSSNKSTDYSIYLNSVCYTPAETSNDSSIVSYGRMVCRSTRSESGLFRLSSLLSLTVASNEATEITDASRGAVLDTTPSFALFVVSLVLLAIQIVLLVLSSIPQSSQYAILRQCRLPTTFRHPITSIISTIVLILLLSSSALISHKISDFLEHLNQLRGSLSSSSSSDFMIPVITASSRGGSFTAVTWSGVAFMAIVSLSAATEWIVLGKGLIREETADLIRKQMEDSEEAKLKSEVRLNVITDRGPRRMSAGGQEAWVERT